MEYGSYFLPEVLFSIINTTKIFLKSLLRKIGMYIISVAEFVILDKNPHFFQSKSMGLKMAVRIKGVKPKIFVVFIIITNGTLS